MTEPLRPAPLPGPAEPGLDPLALPLQGSRLIEASAGTGKTWTLAALVLRLVLGDGVARPLAPSDILVMSFTRAATRELRERIRARLAEAAAVLRGERSPAAGDTLLPALLARNPTPPATLALRLALAADGMDEAAVQTIDAWCQRVLHEHAFASGSAFDETLVSDPSGWHREAARGYWREQVYPLNGAALDAVLALWPDVQALERSMAPLLKLGEVQLPAAPGGTLAAWLEADRLALAGLKHGWVERAGRYEAWLARLRTLKAKPLDWRLLRSDLVEQGFEKLRAWAADPMAEAFDLGAIQPRLAADALQALAKPGHRIEPPPEAEAYQALLAALAARTPRAVALRAHALLHLRQRIVQLQQASASLGFADVQQRLANALDDAVRGEPARVLRQRVLAQYPVALVDEFQDTSPLQLAIFERLYGLGHDDPARTLLLIGDPKQSIYGFRGADIHSYLRAARAVGTRRHSLSTNHRSTAALVAVVNHLFSAAEAREGAAAALRAAAGPAAGGSAAAADEAGAFRFEAGALPFVPVRAAGRAERLVADGAPLEALCIGFDALPVKPAVSQRRLAEACALRIASLLGDAGAGFERPGQAFVPLGPGDCAVLVRNRHEAAAVHHALARHGVPAVYLSHADSVFASPEAADLLRLLDAVAEPRDARRVRAALATALVGWPLARLVALADDDAELEQAVAGFAELRQTWRRHGVLPMLRQALHRWIEPARWRGEDGARALTNLLHLAELLQQAAGSLDGEHALRRWLATAIAEAGAGAAPADEQLLRLESDARRVRIVTIHKSKGLQYPLVFLPFATAARRATRPGHVVRADAAGRRLLHLQLDDAMRAEARRDDEREALRLLYVALTRAEHALWLGAGVTNSGRGAASAPSWPSTPLGWLLSGSAALDAAGIGQCLQQLQAACPSVRLMAPWPEADAGAPPPPLRWRNPQPAVALAPPRPLPPHHACVPWTVGSYSGFVRGLALASPLAPAQQGWRDDEPDRGPGEAGEDTPGADPAPGAGQGPDPGDIRGAEPGIAWPAEGFAEGSAEESAQGSTAESRQGRAEAGDQPARPPAWRPIQHRFVRGSAAGQFLHEQLEWLAGDGAARRGELASAPADWRRRCERAGHGAEAAALGGWMAQVMDTPLPPLGVPLAGLQRRWPELEFWLPTEGLDAAEVDRLCRRHVLPGQERPPLPARRLRGLLMGFADLVFAHDDRYGVVDHKSNALGDDDSAYTESALAQAVLQHRYDVQAALYLVALHRLLRARLGPAYAQPRHLQGALFLFLRGIGAPGAGAWWLAPAPALIDGLDALFAPPGTVP